MKGQIEIVIGGANRGYIVGPSAQKIQPLITKAVNDGWDTVADKIPSSENTRVYQLPEPINGFYKEFLSRSKIESIKTLIKGSRAKRHIEQSTLLVNNGFNSPLLLAEGCLDNRDFVVTQTVPGFSFGDFLGTVLRRPDNKKDLHWKRSLITSVGALIGGLHSVGIVHGDLRPNNLLLAEKEGKSHWYFIDNERNKKSNGPVRRRDIIKNLVQMNMLHPVDMTMTDRRRFFSAYFSVYPSPYNPREIEKETIKKALDRLSSKPVFDPQKHRIESSVAIARAFARSGTDK